MLTAAIPAASTAGERVSDVRAQNGPFNAKLPISTKDNRINVIVSESVSKVAAKLIAVSASGIAVLKIRSAFLSARMPQKIMKTAPKPNGIIFNKPVCISVR
ncbi:hypothetical protein D3C72_1697910 [compost metagenome]